METSRKGRVLLTGSPKPARAPAPQHRDPSTSPGPGVPGGTGGLLARRPWERSLWPSTLHAARCLKTQESFAPQSPEGRGEAGLLLPQRWSSSSPWPLESRGGL